MNHTILSIFTRETVGLAPLAGITDSIYRQVCVDFGARPVMTEMISSVGIVRGHKDDKTHRMLRFQESERPIGIQFFGNDPDIMAEAVARATELNPDFIDINAGCPVKKVVGTGSGSALLRDTALLKQIVGKAVKNSTVPITVKIRSGWDNASINAVDVSKMCEDEGASLIILHPRTRAQGFSGNADWSLIRKVKEAVSIPVVGSGDISSADDVVHMLHETDADSVMIGRAALGNPWIFRQVKERLNGNDSLSQPTVSERLELALRHLDMLANLSGERFAVLNMRKFFGWYSRGMVGGSSFRQNIFRAETREDVRKIVYDFIATHRDCDSITVGE